SGTIDGSLGANTLTGANVANTWSITGSNAGTLTGAGSNVFTNIDNLVGNTTTDSFVLGASGNISGLINGAGGADTLTGANVANTWSITGSNAGTLTSAGSSVFTNIDNLVGNTTTDTFAPRPSSNISGTIDGSRGANTLTGANVANTWSITGSNAGTLTSSG